MKRLAASLVFLAVATPLALGPLARAQDMAPPASTSAARAPDLQQQLEPKMQIPDAPQLPYHFGARPVAPNGEKFGNVASVAFTPKGTLLVYNRNPAIMMVEYDSTGTKVLRTFNPNIAMNPHGMRIDRHGNIWAIDSFLNVIFKMNSKGEVLKMIGTRGENASWTADKWNGMFNQPLDIAFDKDDNFYVVQSHGGSSPPADCTFCATYDYPATHMGGKAHSVFVTSPPVQPGSDPRVLKFDKDFNYITSVSLKHADGLLPVIHTVLVTPAGEVWVGDRASAQILVFDRDLKNRHVIQETNMTSGLTVDAKGQIWMSTGRHGMVEKLAPDGKVLGWFGKHGDNPDSNDIGEGHYLAVSRDEKTIFVADTVLAHVLKLEHN